MHIIALWCNIHIGFCGEPWSLNGHCVNVPLILMEFLVIGSISPLLGANPALQSTPYREGSHIKLYRAWYKPFPEHAVLCRHGANQT